jgi:hypothetical protein
MTWSLDFLAEDWLKISAGEVARRALSRIEAKGRGILLLHDIHPGTADGINALLVALKKRGYRIVHVVPSDPGRPKTVTRPEQWALPGAPTASRSVWPRTLASAGKVALAAPSPNSFGISGAFGPDFQIVYLRGTDVERLRSFGKELPLPPQPGWPRRVTLSASVAHAFSPAPRMHYFAHAPVATATTKSASRGLRERRRSPSDKPADARATQAAVEPVTKRSIASAAIPSPTPAPGPPTDLRPQPSGQPKNGRATWSWDGWLRPGAPARD